MRVAGCDALGGASKKVETPKTVNLSGHCVMVCKRMRLSGAQECKQKPFGHLK